MSMAGVLKIFLRNFKTDFASAVIKILGLAISTSAVIIIWSFVINENKFDKSISTRHRLYRLETNWASMPPFLGHAFNQNVTSQIISTRLNFWQDVGIQVNNSPYNLKYSHFRRQYFF